MSVTKSEPATGWKKHAPRFVNFFSNKNHQWFYLQKADLFWWCIEGESFPPGRGKTSWIHLKHRWCSMVMARNLSGARWEWFHLRIQDALAQFDSRPSNSHNKFQLTVFFLFFTSFFCRWNICFFYSCSCCFKLRCLNFPCDFCLSWFVFISSPPAHPLGLD